AELAETVTPRLVRALVGQEPAAVVAFSPSTEVFAPFSDVVELAVEHGIVLAPRVDWLLPDDDLEPTMGQVAAAGPFASEFVAVSEPASPFVDWWCERQDRAALAPRADRPGPWTELVPALFPSHVLRDPGCGVSMWNLHTREVRAANGGYEVSGSPLRWFHFDGYSPDAPHVLSAELERPRVRLSERTDLTQLCGEHSARLRAAGYDAAKPAFGYASVGDGKEIDPRMRRLYVDAVREASERGDPEPPSPFATGDADAFVAWVNEPVAPPPDPRVSRYLTRV